MFHVKHNDITAYDNYYSYATLTIALNVKYREGDPKELSMYGIRQSKLDPFYDFIIQCLNSGWSKNKTVKAIYEKGYSGSTSNAFDYLCKIEQRENKCFESQPYVRTMTECVTYSHHLNLIDFEVGASCTIALRAKIKQAIPACPAVFISPDTVLLRCHAHSVSILFPSFMILTAAFTSRSILFPHSQ